MGLLVCVPSGRAHVSREGPVRVFDGAVLRDPAPAPSELDDEDGSGVDGSESEYLSREALWHGVLAVLTRCAKATSVSGQRCSLL